VQNEGLEAASAGQGLGGARGLKFAEWSYGSSCHLRELLCDVVNVILSGSVTGAGEDEVTGAIAC
jgi:hypothetical protein